MNSIAACGSGFAVIYSRLEFSKGESYALIPLALRNDMYKKWTFFLGFN